MTKERVREEGIKYMEENAIDDLKYTSDFTSQPVVQEGLGMYLASLKKSK